MSKKNNLKTLDQFVDEQYGKKGTTKRDKFEEGFKSFKLGFLLRQARLEKGLTQEELAEKCGTNKGYISKIKKTKYDCHYSVPNLYSSYMGTSRITQLIKEFLVNYLYLIKALSFFNISRRYPFVPFAAIF